MKTITCVLAILAAASTAAVAKDLGQDKKAAAPAATATQMSDAEMDRVTAGDGFGFLTAQDQTPAVANAVGGLAIGDSHSQQPGPGLGVGVITAGK